MAKNLTMNKDELGELAEEFFRKTPNGTKKEFLAFVRYKEAAKITEAFDDYVAKRVKELQHNPDEL